MPRGRQLAPLTLDPETRKQLTSLAQSTALPHSLVLRAKMILASAEGLSNTAVGRRVGASAQAVGKWRRRFLELGLEGLHDELRPGRPAPTTTSASRACSTVPCRSGPRGLLTGARAPWPRPRASPRAPSAGCCAPSGSNPTAARRQVVERPVFRRKVRDIVGLYLNPPEHAVVLCEDEKSQVQALDRTQRPLPMDVGYVEGFTHDYIRHGTTTLFAALEAGNGEVIACCAKRHRH